MRKKTTLALLFIAFVFTGCIHINLYEKQVPIPAQEWRYDFSPEFNFEIKDTVSTFLLYVVIRHTDMYQFNNLWLRIGTQPPGDTMSFQNLNLQLASGNRWEGLGVNDIYEVRKLISPGPIPFRKAGEYTFNVSQIMRENPLKYILDVGIRLEKVE